MIEGHGDDIYRYGDKIKHNFSSNICQYIDHDALTKHLASRLTVVSNYPEPAPYSVEETLSHRLGIDTDCIMVTNGAVDAIYIMAQAFRGYTSAVLQPTFSEYADACRTNGHTVISFDCIGKLPEEASMVWICNPNNPTGSVIPADILQKYISDNPDKIFVIDQSYHKYTEARLLTPAECARLSNIILLYSLTKDYGIPGLRLGYAVGNPEVIATFKRYRTPWSVNALAIEAAHHLLNLCDESFDRHRIISEAKRTADALSAMGIYTHPSETNYILCRLPKGSAASLKAYLIERSGILIRDASNFEGLTDRHFRVAVQTPAENDLLVNSIYSWLHS